jgi:2-polyprenyl-3-methyl-5-hydroxy-6-metoxy-1,4-benzoquinol methylase
MSRETQAAEQAEVEQDRDALVERMLQSMAGVFDVVTVYMGDQLGYYRALASSGPLTSVDLASQTGTNERYTREWLEQQTVTGLLRVDDADAAPEARRFSLPQGYVEILTDKDSLNYLAPLAQLGVGAVSPVHKLLEAYRTGQGIPFSDYGVDVRDGQANINRPAFLFQLGQEWIPVMPDVHARLGADPPARIADIGCGGGWSSIGMALAYPKVRVDGYDLDEASVELARANASQYDLGGRITFQARDAGDPGLEGSYDLVTAFECVHDMSDPVRVLRVMRGLAGEEGTVLVVDERVGDKFTPTGNDVEWMMYGWSVLHCLPVGMSEQPSAATGTVMRTDTLRRYAHEAGFSDVEVLPIDNFFFRFYRLK